MSLSEDTEYGSVLIVLDPEYGEQLSNSWPGRAVWVVTSPSNDRVARELWAQHPEHDRRAGLTLFDQSHSPNAEHDLFGNFDMIELHHGAIASLEVIGLRPTAAVTDALRTDGFAHIVETSSGFVARR